MTVRRIVDCCVAAAGAGVCVLGLAANSPIPILLGFLMLFVAAWDFNGWKVGRYRAPEGGSGATNPATGLLMTSGTTSGVDTAGNAYGSRH